MRLIVNTNILVRAARNDDDKQSPQAHRLLGEATVIVVSALVLSEFDWVMRKHYKWPRASVIDAMRMIIAAPNSIVDADLVAAGLVFLEAGANFADGVIAFDGRRRGGRVFASFDRDACRIAAAAGYAVI